MIRLFCDKCGSECSGSYRIRISEPNCDRTLHVCPKCFKSFKRWLRREDAR